MSEARFDRIDAWQHTADERFDRIDRKFDAVDLRFEAVDRRFDAVDGRFEAVDQRIDDLHAEMNRRFDEQGREMRFLHEQAMTAIADSRGYTGPTKEEFAELKELLARRIEPLEVAVRHHSTEIDRLKKRRG